MPQEEMRDEEAPGHVNPEIEAMDEALKSMAGATEAAEAKLLQQPSWKRIEELQAKSSFERSDGSNANCTIEFEGRKFTIEVLESGKDKAVKDVQKMFEKNFGKEEVDSIGVLRSAIDGVTEDGTPQPKYRITTIRDEKGKLVCTMAGAMLEVLGKDKQPTGEAVYSIGYAVTNPKARMGGLAREAYTSGLMDATKEANAQGKKLNFAMGECTHTSEAYWNKVGWKRVYGKNEDGTEMKEVEYVQPALDFSSRTGKIAKDAGEVPEHLMIDGFGQHDPSREEVLSACNALVDYNVRWSEDSFDNAKAYKTQSAYVDANQATFAQSLSSIGEITYLSIGDREEAKMSGAKIHGYDAADHGDAGKEDF